MQRDQPAQSGRKDKTMTKIHFDLVGVRRLIEHAAAAPKHQRELGQKGRPKPALMLVGDDGIYLMSSGIPGLMVPSEIPDTAPKNFVVYASECHPLSMDFDRWWSAKVSIFGGDDGCEHIDLDDINTALATYPETQNQLIIDVTPQSIALVMFKANTKATASPA
jgi:hypothetical protein